MSTNSLRVAIDTNGEVHVGSTDHRPLADAHDAVYFASRRGQAIEDGTDGKEADDLADLADILGDARALSESGAHPEATFRIHLTDIPTIIGALALLEHSGVREAEHDAQQSIESWSDAFYDLLPGGDDEPPQADVRARLREDLGDAVDQ